MRIELLSDLGCEMVFPLAGNGIPYVAILFYFARACSSGDPASRSITR